jgi:hypothetical protein
MVVSAPSPNSSFKVWAFVEGDSNNSENVVKIRMNFMWENFGGLWNIGYGSVKRK